MNNLPGWIWGVVGSLVFTGLISLGAQVEIELGPIPFILSDFFVLLAGLVLGARYAGLAVGLYLGLGAIGLPVFAGGEGGAEHLFGPSGGYLWGFLLGAILLGWIAHRQPRTLLKNLLGTAVGQATIFLLGVPWLKFVGDLSWATSLEAGFAVFWFPILAKFLVANLLAWIIIILAGNSNRI